MGGPVHSPRNQQVTVCEVWTGREGSDESPPSHSLTNSVVLVHRNYFLGRCNQQHFVYLPIQCALHTSQLMMSCSGAEGPPHDDREWLLGEDAVKEPVVRASCNC